MDDKFLSFPMLHVFLFFFFLIPLSLFPSIDISLSVVIYICLRHHLALKSDLQTFFFNEYSLQKILYNLMIWAFKSFPWTMILVKILVLSGISRTIINFKALDGSQYIQENQNQIWMFIARSKIQVTPAPCSLDRQPLVMDTQLTSQKNCMDHTTSTSFTVPLKTDICSRTFTRYRVYIHFP